MKYIRALISILFLTIPSLALAASSCSQWQELRFADGSTGCMTDYKFFSIKHGNSTEKGIQDTAIGKAFYAVALIKNPASCPVHWTNFQWGWKDSSSRAVKRCEDNSIAEVLNRNQNPAGCECELILDTAPGVAFNVPMGKEEFEAKTRSYLARIQNDQRFSNQFSDDEKKANTAIYNTYAKRWNNGNAQVISNANSDSERNSTDKKIELEKAQIAFLENEKKALADKARIQDEQNKQAQLERDRKALIEKAKAEQDKKIAEEKRLQLAAIEQERLEKEQKLLAEKVKLEQDLIKKTQLEKAQAELAQKARDDREKKLVEEKRIQLELAQKEQQEKEKRDLFEKTRLEQSQKANNNVGSQLARIEALEKEKIELLGRLQSEQLSREKSLLEAQQAVSQSKDKINSNKTLSSQTTKSVKALIIGNSAYKVSALTNPANDAQAFAKRLTEFGFKVDLVLDGNRKTLITALSKFQNDSSKYDVNILFYAGHGIQLNGVNYIIPIDMSLAPNGANVEFDAIPVNSVVEKYMQSNTKLVFLDACRDNPLSRSLQVASRSSGGSSRGLAAMEVGGGTLISYSTKDGSVALDGDGKNSPYTEAMLAHMNERIDISLLLRKVRKTVMEKTNGKQVPWDYGSLMTDELVLSNK